MKNTEYIIKVLSKKYDILEKEVEKVVSFNIDKIINNMKTGEYDGIYFLRVGTFYVDKYLIFKQLKSLLHMLKKLKNKTNTTKLNQIKYDSLCVEFKKLWLIKQRINK